RELRLSLPRAARERRRRVAVVGEANEPQAPLEGCQTLPGSLGLQGQLRPERLRTTRTRYRWEAQHQSLPRQHLRAGTCLMTSGWRVGLCLRTPTAVCVGVCILKSGDGAVTAE